jgi:outer membrane protein OmpA-like peptidoglycan-associated protein
MRRFPGNPVEEFEELRRLLLSPEREQLRDLRDQITNKERRSNDVAAVLPAAVKLSRDRGDELSRALRPAVEESIKESLEKTPETFVDALSLIVGPIVWRSIAESFRRFLQSRGRTTRAGVVLAAAAAVAIFGIVLAARSESRWRNFLARLNAQPSLVVTDARKGWFSHSQVSGLRDASAADPEMIARQEKLDPAGIRFQWKGYLALDPASVRRRFEQRFGIPNQTQVTVENGALTLAGSVPYEWLERVRREATLIPGVASLAEHDVKVAYDPGSVLKRFEEKFGLPETMHVVLANSVLTLSGRASHGWLARVGSEATKMPGIASVDERNVIDLDQRAFQHSKSIIENAFVYFVMNKDDITTEGFATLSRLPEEINRCANAAKQFGLDIALEIHGHADAVGDESKNVDLGQRRANRVRDFLVSCGVASSGLTPIGMEQPLKGSSGEEGLPEQSERLVSFKVVSR